MALAERVSLAITDLGIAHPDSPHGVVTVSIGVATGLPAHGMQPFDLYERADRACYGAKQRGRNCCVSFTDEVSEHPRV
jgi:diguanylate cyclase (GGDEF)-like protein